MAGKIEFVKIMHGHGYEQKLRQKSLHFQISLVF